MLTKITSSNPIQEMHRRKEHQINYLYDLAMDRIEGALLNGKPFVKSPRMFYEKNRDNFHYRATVEVIEPEDYFVPGDYLQYNEETWLCIESKEFHGMYCSGTFQKCNWLLKWQDKYTGKIHEYWCIDENATQYNSGEMTNKSMVFRMGSTQHILTLPYDEHTVLIETPMRFFLDRNPIHPTSYQVTQNDNTPYNYKGKGLCRISVFQCETDNDTDRPDLGICDYIDPEKFRRPKGKFTTEIIAADYIVRSGGSSRTIGAEFKKNGEIMDDIIPIWNVRSDFTDRLKIQEVDNLLKISVDDDSLVGSLFTVELSEETGEYPTAFKEFSIVSIYS